MGHALTRRPSDGRTSTVGFAVKLIAIGIFAGLTIIYCQVLIDACFRGLH
jgi:hypothetical protein